jgi:hypothetical protein
MKLPYLENAIVPASKITDYLLSAAHRDGRHKAAFFTRFGFAADDWETLAAALLRHAAEHEVAKIEASPFGARYVIEGELRAPDGRAPRVRVVWFMATGETTPYLVTAYPL